jgi:hypothetical protein
LKILGVAANNHRRAFEIRTRGGTYTFPYAWTDPTPGPDDRIVEARVDEELGSEAVYYRLESGGEGAVHVDSVLEYNQDPTELADLLLYRLTVEAQEQVERSGLPTREIARRLETSPTQLYRLLDATNYGKSLRQMLALLYALGCDVDFTVKGRGTA